MYGQSAMKTHRHHAGIVRAFGMEHVEGILEKFEKLAACRHGATAELAIIVGQRIEHDQMIAALPVGKPVGKLLVVDIGVVFEPTFLDQQAPGVRAGSIAAVPAQRPLPRFFSMDAMARAICSRSSSSCIR